MSPLISVFIQARMSSHRFPGKVLAPFRGVPLIHHVIASVKRALPKVQLVVSTSSEGSDDPLVSYLQTMGVTVFRGPLDNVFERFRLCVREYSCEWVLRLSGDSPLLDCRVLQAVVSRVDSNCDLVTTIFPRTFPKGHNAELIQVSSLLAINGEKLSSEDREHVTPFFYRNPGGFRIVNVESGDPRLAEFSLAVDTVADLHRLEQLSEEDLHKFTYTGLSLKDTV